MLHDRQIFIDEQPLVNDVDFKIANPQTIVRKFEFVGRGDDRRIALRFKVFAKQFELFLGRHSLEVDDGDVRRAFRLAPQKFLVAVNQDFEHQGPAIESAQLISLRETLHHRKLLEDFEGSVCVSNSRRTLSVQLDEAVGLVS